MSNDQLLKFLRLSGERSSADGSGLRICDEAADAIERLSAANLSLESRVSQQARTIAEVFQKVGDMERDAARYRWLRRQAVAVRNYASGNPNWEIDWALRGESFEAAVDAAMTNKEQP